jgi:hypothetical protein
MMKLCPVKYGVRSSFPSGNVWLGVEFLGSYLYDWNFVATAQTFTPSGFAPYSSLRAGTNIYYTHAAANSMRYAPVSNPSNTLEITPSAAAFGIVTDGTYIYKMGGVNNLERMTLPSGSFSTPSSDNANRADSALCLGGKVFVVSVYNPTVNRSSDLGVNWTSGANNFAGGASLDGCRLAANPSGSRIFVAYQLSSGSSFNIKYSDDDGDTWSATVLTFAGTLDGFVNLGGFSYVNGKYLLITNLGKTYSSSDGLSWTAGAVVPFDVNRVSFGISKTIAICGYNRIYETTDDGGNWSLVTLPSAPTANAGDIPSTVWIGENP